jgi:tetratricopeptide (TPR) repeat protein
MERDHGFSRNFSKQRTTILRTGEHHSAGRHETGILPEYEKAIEMDAKVAMTSSLLCQYYHAEGMRQGEMSRLSGYYERKLQQDRYRCDLWYWRGDIHRVSRRYESAISSYEHALKLKPRHAWLWERLGKAFEEKGDIIGAANGKFRKTLQFHRSGKNSLLSTVSVSSRTGQLKA